MELSEKRYRQIRAWCLYGALLFIGIYLFARYLYRPLLPFLTAFVIAASLQSAVRRMSEKTGKSRKLFSVILVLAVTAGLALLLFSLFNTLIYGMRSVISFFGDNAENFGTFFSEWRERFNDFLSQLPFYRRSSDEGSVVHALTDAIDGFIREFPTKLVGQLSDRLPRIIGAAASAIPSVLFFLVITLLAAVYFCCDYDKIRKRVFTVLPAGLKKGIPLIKGRMTDTVKKYLRACFILLMLTFGELLVGFLLLGVPYPAGRAVLIALVDFLPVLGVGSVLIPWALIAFLTGDLFRGIGLIVLYVVIAVIRQIMEPRIVGTSIGLSPLLTLVGMYVGLKLCGIAGMILFPLGMTVLRGLLLPAEATR